MKQVPPFLGLLTLIPAAACALDEPTDADEERPVAEDEVFYE